MDQRTPLAGPTELERHIFGSSKAVAIPRLNVDFNWKTPDFTPVFEQRAAMLQWLRENPEEVDALKDFYADNEGQFINDWGITFDPRNAERKLPTLMPFLLFDKQVEWIDYVIRKWRAQEHGLTEKSRDCGVTWLAICLSCTLCLFNDGLAIGFGSRKEEYVDKVGTIKPILPKGRMFMEHLPEEFRGGWVRWRDAPHMRINFPETGSIIVGEAGDQIGRGDRESIYFVDEAQPLDAKVLTTSGWQTMSDMHMGSIVVGPDGRRRSVIQVKDCGVHDVFRVTFADGTSTECSPNHLWTVNHVWGNKRRETLRTHEIADRFVYRSPGGQTQYRYRVPAYQPIEFDQGDPLPLDPYIVGALLGDGSVLGGTNCVKITTADQQVLDEIRKALPVGIVIGAFDGRYTHNIIDQRGRIGRAEGGSYPRSRAKLAVTAAGLIGFKGPDKFVPDRYLRGSVKDRLALLQGLMDTDGSVNRCGVSGFYTSSMKLANDVRFLVQSLGGRAHLNVKPDARGYRDQYAIHLVLPEGMAPFRLQRKLNRLKPRRNSMDRTIVGIEHVGRKPVRCITVDAEDGLYLTDHCIVTHNSAYLERPQMVEYALSQTTNCRMDISSVNGMANPFAQKRFSGRVEPFIFDWRDDPRKDDEWYQKQVDSLDPVVVAQEIDRDYSASVAGIVIPAEWVRACVNACERLGIEPQGIPIAALDVADEGVDKNAICGGKGVEVQQLIEWSGRGADLYDTTQKAIDFCDLHGYRAGFRYDADGLGASVRGDARTINEKRREAGARPCPVEGWRGSAGVVDPEGIVEGTRAGDQDEGRKNKDMFANAKAQGWWSLRRRVQKTFLWVRKGIKCNPDEIISISSECPLYAKMMTELSQPTYKTNGAGKIVIDKTPDGMASPNLADAVMMRFAPGEVVIQVSNDVLKRIAALPPRRRFR
jgi:hypothetical protein